ncbi:MAG: hypothetical protein QM520_01685, partial [Gammaproteobacteria bacterium]|nr:hypothetical protein [Gammaproteobacteria bacterium]
MKSWREQFQLKPEQALADLFRGRTTLGISLRRDLPQVLYDAFPAEQPADRTKLDRALFDWLSTMRDNYAQEVRRLGFDVYSLRIGEALEALQLLELPESREKLRQAQAYWLAWLVPLRLAPERDPALALHRLLTQGQTDDQAVASWLQLAANPRSEYLSVALLGLQRLPGNDQRQHQTLQVSALLRHYGQQSGTLEQQAAAFHRRFAALRGLYPRSPQHWQEVLMDALLHTSHGSSQYLPEFARTLQPEKPKKNPKSSAPACPSWDQNKQAQDAIKNRQIPSQKASQQMLQLLEGYRRYAQYSGDGYYFVHSLCNHGNLLLKRADINVQTLQCLGSFIDRALEWEPRNAYVWNFWATWLAYQHLVEQQLWVLRETVRLFPGNAPSRVELARILMRLGEAHWPEAEGWLRQAAERNPNNAHSRVELARLLMRLGEAHWPEAEGWLRQAAERNPNNAHSRVELARLLMRLGEAHWPEAEGWLRQAAERNPNNAHSRVELARLLMRLGEA